MKKTGAKLLADCLVAHGVKTIFGIPGAKIDAMYDALLDTDIKVVVCRHEQNAAFIAAMIGRLTGKPGVVLVTSGPGVANLTTGLLTATTEGDPIVAIGGNVPRHMRLKESHQSSDNVKLLEAATKSSVEVAMVENIPEIIENAFRAASEPRAGAAFVSVPQDILQEKTELSVQQPVPKITRGSAPEYMIEQAATLLNQAKQPAILVGLEASRPENTKAIRQLLQKTVFPIVGTYQAAGVVPREFVDYFIGRVGLFKNQPGDRMLDAADVILTIGFNPVEYDPEVWNKNGGKPIIHLDYNPVDIHTAYLPKLEILGDIAANIEALTQQIKKRKTLHDVPMVKKLHAELEAKIKSGANYTKSPIHPLRFIHDLREMVDDDVTIICDVGSHYMWFARYFFSYKPHHLLFSNGQQTLGVALPWAIATNYARPGGKVVSISGDGGFLFSAMELETAVREKTNFVHFVWCDGSYNMVLEQQMIKYGRESAVRFGSVDIVEFAKSFGAQGYRIKQPDDLKPLLKEVFSQQCPVLVEVPIDYSDNPEMFKAAYQRAGS